MSAVPTSSVRAAVNGSRMWKKTLPKLNVSYMAMAMAILWGMQVPAN